jgi:hypothetical protein
MTNDIHAYNVSFVIFRMALYTKIVTIHRQTTYDNASGPGFVPLNTMNILNKEIFKSIAHSDEIELVLNTNLKILNFYN